MSYTEACLQGWLWAVLKPLLLTLLSVYLLRPCLLRWFRAMQIRAWAARMGRIIHRHQRAMDIYKRDFFKTHMGRGETSWTRPTETALQQGGMPTSISILDVGFSHGTNLEYFVPNSHVTCVCVQGKAPWSAQAICQRATSSCHIRLVAQLAMSMEDDLVKCLRKAGLATRYDVIVADGYLCRATNKKAALRVLLHCLYPGGRLLVLQHVLAAWWHPARWVQVLLGAVYWYAPGGCDVRTWIHATDLRDTGFTDITVQDIRVAGLSLVDCVFQPCTFVSCARME